MKFTKLEEYREQAAKALERSAEAEAAKSAAFEELQGLKRQYEDKLRTFVETGVGGDSEIDALADRITEAERRYQRKVRECEMITVIRGKGFDITPETLVTSWNTEFKPKFKAEKFDPAAQALLDAKMAYFEAVIRYKGVVADYEAAKRDVIWTLHPSDGRGKYAYSFGDLDFKTTSEVERYFIQSYDLVSISAGKVPDNMKDLRRDK